jgi:cell division protein FtsZ
VAIRGAKRVLFNISGGEDMTLFEVNEVAELIGNAIDTAADITFGAVIDPALDDVIRVTLIAAGMHEIRGAHLPAAQLEQAPPPHPSQTPAMPGLAPSSQPPSVQPHSAHPRTSPGQPLDSADADYAEQLAALPPISQTPADTGQSSRQRFQPPGSQAPRGRPQRSLDDLRGLRSMGLRREMLRGRRGTRADTGDVDEEVDVPPFMKRYQ